MSGGYRSGAGRSLRLGEKLADGAAGAAFTLEGDPTVIFKLLADPSPEDESRMKAMLQMGVPTTVPGAAAVIAWPTDLVLDATGRYVGFLMPCAPGPEPLTLSKLVLRRERERNVGKNLGWDALLGACESYAAGIAALHSFPIVVSDINLKNVVVSGDLTVTVIDCDSVQIDAGGQFFGSKYCQLEFLAPELQEVADLAAHRRDQASDRWALAVLIWMTLMDGFHPFAGVWSGVGEPFRDEHAAAGRFPYAKKSPLAPAPEAPPWRALPRELQKLFTTAFTDGARRPDRRPTAMEWQKALKATKGKLKECDGKLGRRHRFPASEKTCPWCEYERFLESTDPAAVPRLTLPKLPRLDELPAAVGRGGVRVLAGGAACLLLTLILAIVVTFDVGVSLGMEIAAAWHLVWVPVAIATGCAWAGGAAHDVVQARSGGRFWLESIPPAYLAVAGAAIGGAFLAGAVGDGAVPPSAWSDFPLALCAAFLVALLIDLLLSRVAARATALLAALALFMVAAGGAWAAAPRSDLPSKVEQMTVDHRLAGAVPLAHCHPRSLEKLEAGLLRNSLDGVVFCHGRHIRGRFLAFADDDLLGLYGAEQKQIAEGRGEAPADECNSRAGVYVDTWYRKIHPSRTLGELLCFGRHKRGVLKWEDPRDDLFAVVRGAGRRPDYVWWRTHPVPIGWR